MVQGSAPRNFHPCLCISTIPIRAQHQLLCTNTETYVSRLEAIFCFVPAPSGNHHSGGSSSLPISLLFFSSLLRTQYVSQSIYPNMPCESGEGRDHHHLVVPRLPKAPAHADHHVDSLYPWWANITHQCSHTVCDLPDICSCGFLILYYREKLNGRLITAWASYRVV